MEQLVYGFGIVRHLVELGFGFFGCGHAFLLGSRQSVFHSFLFCILLMLLMSPEAMSLASCSHWACTSSTRHAVPLGYDFSLQELEQQAERCADLMIRYEKDKVHPERHLAKGSNRASTFSLYRKRNSCISSRVISLTCRRHAGRDASAGSSDGGPAFLIGVGTPVVPQPRAAALAAHPWGLFVGHSALDDDSGQDGLIRRLL